MSRLRRYLDDLAVAQAQGDHRGHQPLPVDMAEALDLIVELRERNEKLESAADEARAVLAERRQYLDSADTIATFDEEMSEFLKESELTERRAFIESFVKEIVGMPGDAVVR